MNILVINAGSSSLKYQLMDPDTGVVTAKGLCERIGLDGRLTHKVPARDLERAARAGGRFFKQQHHVLALQVTMGRSGALEIFKITRQIEQIPDLRRRVVDELQKMSSSDVDGHKIYLL